MEETLTVEELAKILKISRVTLRRWVVQKKIPFGRAGRQIRFDRKEVEAFVFRGGK